MLCFAAFGSFVFVWKTVTFRFAIIAFSVSNLRLEISPNRGTFKQRQTLCTWNYSSSLSSGFVTC